MLTYQYFIFFGINIVSVRLAQALFGAFIVFLLYVALIRMQISRIIALVMSIGLATDIAFLASFRTQFYIILGGEAWLFCSLCFIPFNNISNKHLTPLLLQKWTVI